MANFQNEAVALDRVRHPNVINRLGHGTAIDLAGTTFHYIVLEYLPGGDMLALSRRQPLSIEKTLFYLEQVCSVWLLRTNVEDTRDIKPQNLLLLPKKNRQDRDLAYTLDANEARSLAWTNSTRA